MISAVVFHALGVSLSFALFDCWVTLTTSKGLIKIASVKPANSPASEKV